MKKSLFAAALLSLVLAACGGEKAAEAPATEAPAAEAPATEAPAAPHQADGFPVFDKINHFFGQDAGIPRLDQEAVDL
ncbi:hypothetical protein E0W55_07285, partial [Neisseria meningitidis]|nr:hypothetical protein [Neisseria meningitidis]